MGSIDTALEAYQTGLETLQAFAQTKVDAAMSLVVNKFDYGVRYINSYFQNQNVTNFIDDKNFQTKMNNIQKEIASIVGQFVGEAEVLYSDNISFVQQDVNRKLSDLYYVFNQTVTTPPMDDNFSYAYPTAVSAINQMQSEFSNWFYNLIYFVAGPDVYNRTSQFQLSASSMFVNFRNNRPLLRILNADYPKVMTPGAPADIKVSLQNVSIKPWSGWIGVIITDEYLKKYELNSADKISMIQPNETQEVTRNFIVPRELPRKTDGRILPIGKKLSVRLKINRRND